MLVLMGSIVFVSPMQANVHSSRTCRLLGFISRKRDVLRHLTRLSAGFEERSTCRTLSASPSTCLLVGRTEPTRWLNATQASRYWRRSSDVRVQRSAVRAQRRLTVIEGSYARIHFFFFFFLYDSFLLNFIKLLSTSNYAPRLIRQVHPQQTLTNRTYILRQYTTRRISRFSVYVYNVLFILSLHCPVWCI